MEPLNNLEKNGKVFPVSLRPENTVFSPIAERGDVIMNVGPLAGKPTEPSMLANIPRLVTAYYTGRPDHSVPEQRVAFGLKVMTENGWFAARPLGTEDVYKIYAEKLSRRNSS